MKTKYVIGLVGGALILLIVLYIIGKNYGKQLGAKPIKIPDEDYTPDGNLNENHLTDAQANEITKRLYDDIRGWSIIPASLGGRDVEVYGILLQLPDLDLVKISNIWDKLYYSEFNQTLLAAMKDEYYNEMGALADNIKTKLEYIEKKYRNK